MIRQLFLITIGLLCSFTLPGCSGGGEGGEDRVDVVPVKGKVTLLGNPLAGVFVVYSPVDAKACRPATGKTDDNGNYTLRTYEPGDGAAPGEYVVIITESGSTTSETSPEAMHQQYTQGGAPASHVGGKKGAGDKSTLNPRYSNPTDSDLKVTVTKDQDTYNLDLKP